MKPLLSILLLSCTLLGSAALAAEDPIGVMGQGGSWRFLNGGEFPGATGKLDFKIMDGRPVGVLDFDLSKGGKYVTAFSTVDLGPDVSELRFRVKSDKPVNVNVRLRDSSGQYHQFILGYNTVGQWQTLRQLVADIPQKHAHYSGNNDGIVAFPVKEVWILASPGPKADDKTGQLLFGDLRAIR